MKWFKRTLIASIGKKTMMAVTGLCFCAFLGAHLGGALTLYGGRDAFNSYADRLHALGPLVTAAELILLALALVHILTGVILFYRNRRARPVSYAMKAGAGGRTVGSRTMPYTGLLLLLFIVIHLFQFHFVEKGDRTIYDIVAETFHQPFYAGFYILAAAAAAVHVSHGFWSAFQTIGANHPKYTPLINGAGLAFSLIVGIGFGCIPIYIAFL